MNSIGDMRHNKGFSQLMLARLLGVSQQAVAQWEIGKAYPRSETLVKLADALDCTIDELYGRKSLDKDLP